MHIWAIGDLHLSHGIPDKKMDFFGPEWEDHASTIKKSWDALVAPEDIVLIPGDISWAMRLEEALADLQWIHERPGIKILIKGNHDYWWGSLKKVRETLPASIHVIQNDSICLDNVAIGGAKLHESTEYAFQSIIDFKPNVRATEKTPLADNASIFDREVHRLELSLASMPQNSRYRIAMTHFPPIGLDLAPSRASQLFEQYGVSLVVFGHLHSVKKNIGPLFGTARGVTYVLASSDVLNFTPLHLMSMPSTTQESL